MAFKIGIVPAAGKAERFGGILKELLPAHNGKSFLCHAINRLPVDMIVLITNPIKVRQHMIDIGQDAVYVMQKGDGLWGAILTALEFDADEYYFTMPDTMISDKAFNKAPEGHLVFGTFETGQPERFGCIVDEKIIDKPEGLEGNQKAWGIFRFSYEVADLWREVKLEDYTAALNLAIDLYGLKTWDIGKYHDNANIQEYLYYMAGVTWTI